MWLEYLSLYTCAKAKFELYVDIESWTTDM